MANNIQLKIKKGETSMSLIRKELTILGYESIIKLYLELNNYKPTNGKFIANRPWLNIDSEKRRFTIDYENYIKSEFNAEKRDVFLNYISDDESSINESKLNFLKEKPNLLTRKIRSVEEFMFNCEKNKKEKKQDNNNVFFKNKYSPSITKGPVDEICLAVSNKENFQKFEEVFDIINTNNMQENKIKVDNYGMDYDMNDVNLSIDVVTENDNIILNNEEELVCFQEKLDKKLEEASKYLSQDTEKLLRYLQTIRYYETKNKPVLDGYTAIMDIDVDDILRAFDLKICPQNRMNILNQLNQISNLTLNVKIDKETQEYKHGKKRNKKDVLYVSSKLINFSYGIKCTQYTDEVEQSVIKYIDNIKEISIDSIGKIRVNISWTDVFERLYKDGETFLNLNLPSEVFQLPRYKVKDFDLCMYLAKISNSTLSNTNNKKKETPMLSLRLLKFIEAMNAVNELESTRKKGEKLNKLLDILENSIDLYIRNGILKELTLTEFKNNRHLIKYSNYKDFKLTLYFTKNKQLEAEIS